jgi:hypothetical protein
MKRTDILARLPLVETAVFVSAEEGARRCMVSDWKWREWVRTGKIMPPHVNDGQIQRWHWPSVEAQLAAEAPRAEDNPFAKGLADVSFTSQRRRKRAAP